MFSQNVQTEQTYELTQSQLSMWTGQMLNPEVPLYNMVHTFDIKGEIDTNHFQIAFQELVNRSDSLRTVFHKSKNNPLQKVFSHFTYELEIIDWSSKPLVDNKLQNWINKRSQKILDLSKCTFDSVLIKISNNRYVWYFNEHHLTTDARSSSITFTKMSELYVKSTKGEIEELLSFPTFQSFVKHEKKNRTDSKLEAVNKYWQKKARTLPTPPRLYGQTNLSTTTASKRMILDLGIKRSNALRELTKKSDLRAFTADLSLFNIYSTVLIAYLHRVSGQNNLMFGTPVHNRTTSDFKETLGVFIEFFPFANKIKHDETFISLFKRVKTETFEFLRNAQSGTSTPSSNRSFNVVLNYIQTNFPDFAGIPSEATWHHPNHSDASHHMRLHVYNDVQSDSIQLYFDLNCDVFSEEMLKTVPNHFLKLLDAFIEDPNQLITKTSLLSKAELKELVVDFNQKTKVNKKTVLELFQAQAEQNPDNIAVTHKKENISFVELDEKSNQLANYLISKEITNGKRIALYLNRSTDLIIGILGALKAGCTYVPIATSNPNKRIIEKIELVQTSIVLTHRKLEKNIQDLDVSFLRMDDDWQSIEKQETNYPNKVISPKDLAYIMFTSGSSGIPKGVKISHRALGTYINWAGEKYGIAEQTKFPLFTAIDFDLTVTSIFVPLTTGGSIVVYEEGTYASDLAITDVIEDNRVDVIKLTPSHLSLIKGRDLHNSRIKTMIVGGEDFKTDLAESITKSFHDNLIIYNEYGPTEATVGCISHWFDSKKDNAKSVPIGKPIANTQVYIVDNELNAVPQGVTGKLYLSGKNLSDGYWNEIELSEQKFISNPFNPTTKIYDTGDLVRLNSNGEIDYLGRKDQQVKIDGVRIELGEIEAALAKHPLIESCVVELAQNETTNNTEQITNCLQCGLPSNYPTVKFDINGICNLCLSFKKYQQNAHKYFKTPDDLQELFDKSTTKQQSTYDCLALLSGGKDSTYALAKLKSMGINALAFTLDNGYISNEAKANIQRVTDDLGVDHVYGKTSAMNEIFVDSLKRYSNVCNGCFKTIYTLSMKIALEKNIPFIVTGLSRGQFFETRLTEELFWKDDIDAIDKTILDARKVYHRANDTVNRLLDTSVFQKDSVFEKVQFIDFYRYFDVSFEDMMKYLDEHLPWIRPTDTGRSTNCLINQTGIYVHKKERGYSNYAFPYSWDVRIGHKTRDESLDEINESIDGKAAHKILKEIGYDEKSLDSASKTYLVAHFVGQKSISHTDLKNHLAMYLPAYMIPTNFKQLESLPLTVNGKIDRKTLQSLPDTSTHIQATYTAPETEIEEMLVQIWQKVLQINKIGVNDDFLELGGHSLSAIRIITRTNNAFELDLPLNQIFESPTIIELSKHIETIISDLLSGTEVAKV